MSDQPGHGPPKGAVLLLGTLADAACRSALAPGVASCGAGSRLCERDRASSAAAGGAVIPNFALGVTVICVSKRDGDSTVARLCDVSRQPLLSAFVNPADDRSQPPVDWIGQADGKVTSYVTVESEKTLAAYERQPTLVDEHANHEEDTAAGHMPSQRFAVNATWLKLAIMSYNIASAIKGLCFSPEERTARFESIACCWCRLPAA